MGHITSLWKRFSETNLLHQLNGKLETDFFEYVYRITYIAGLSTSDRSIGYLLYSNILKLIITLFMCCETWFIFIKATSLDAVAQTVSVLLIQTIALYRYDNLISNKPFYNKLATSMNSPYFDISTQRRKEIVDDYALKNETYMNIFLLIGNSTLVIWCLYPLFDEIEYNLITEIYLPFYYKTPILYPIVYFVTVIALAGCAYSVIVTASIMQAHIVHLLCQFTVLADCFENMLKDCSKGFEGLTEYDLLHNKLFADKYMKRLRNLIKQHELILGHSRNLKTIVSRPMLGQLATSGTMMCCVGYQAVMTITENLVKCLVAIMFLGYNVVELYIICHWCEEITTWSIKIGEAIYCSGWECGVAKISGARSTIMLVIARANKPVIFTAGGMYIISIASFASLVKGSYSALTVLLRLRHD